MQWDRIQHRKKAMILQKPKGKGGMTGERMFQDTESSKCQGNRRFGMFTGQEAPVVAAWCVRVSTDKSKTGETLHGLLDLTATSLSVS